MTTLFGIDIAQQLANAMGPGLLPGTLVKITHGNRVDGSLTAGRAATTASYTYKGILDDYTDRQREDSLIQLGDRKALILTKTLSDISIEPVPGDQITMSGDTYRIIKVTRDPADATFECQVRR